MAIERLHHAAFTVTDMDAAVAFYALLGFEPIERPDFGFPGAWLQAGDAQVHLLESPGMPPSDGTHVALKVDDLEAVVSTLEGAGLRIGRLPHVQGAGRQAFVKDPSGNQIELNQPDS
jgi:catechol 2,3-dioxygenase-like lactoylglutathione lyase family enzyme